MGKVIAIPGDWDEEDGREVPILWNYDESRRIGRAVLTTETHQLMGDNQPLQELRVLQAELSMDDQALMALSSEDMRTLRRSAKMEYTTQNTKIVSLSLVIPPVEDGSKIVDVTSEEKIKEQKALPDGA